MRQAALWAVLALALGLPTALPTPARAQVDFGLGQPADPVQVTMVAERGAVVPGEPITVAIRFQIAPKWHVYWVNPAGFGLPITLMWELPEGFKAGDFRSPTPHVYDSPATGGYVHEGEAILLVEIWAPPTLQPGNDVTLKADLAWQACDELTCVPGEKVLTLTLPVAESTRAAGEHAELFKRARAAIPAADADLPVTAAATDSGYTLTLTALPDPENAPQNVRFYSSVGGVTDWTAKQTAALNDGALTLTLPAAPDAETKATHLTGVITADGPLNAAGDRAVWIDASLGGDPAQALDPNVADEPAGAIGVILGLAFLGGLVLNVMPCVFPIISIKVLGFVKQSGEDRKKIRTHGLAFAGGVLASFWVLTGVLLALRAGGEEIGWGFQLQNPAFVAGMTILMVAIGLNLAGVFEVGLGLTTIAGKAEANQTAGGYTGSFFSGVLATLIATPCTGPFMGSAIGAALSQPPLYAWLIFTSVGLGMAVPYIVLAWFPQWLSYMPRPGAWMESFKQFMAFPMFLTAVWLVWVFSTVTEDAQFVWLLVGLTTLAFGAWWYGRWGTPMRKRTVRWTARIAFVLCIAAAFWLPLNESDEMDWREYTPERVAELRREGHVVFVDFTASWCGICQFNKKTALRTDAAEALYREHGVALLERDWSRKDTETLKILQRFGRAGVPLYLVYPADPDAPPEVLPNALTPGIVRDAIERAANGGAKQTASTE